MNNIESGGKRICKQCQGEYESENYVVLGRRILKGNGYCPTCHQKVIAEQTEKEAAVAAATRAAQIAEQKEESLTNCGIPVKYQDESLLTFKAGWQDDALKTCIKYADEFPVSKRPIGYTSLLLWSTSSWGTGKTHLACSILKRIVERWNGDGRYPSVKFISEPDLFRRIQATYSFTRQESQMQDSESDIINRIIAADLLVLDDVGKEPRTDMRFVRRIMFGIINGRYDAKLPIVITANLDPAGLKKHLDEPPTEASFNRLVEMINGKYSRMDGDSYRSKFDG